MAIKKVGRKASRQAVSKAKRAGIRRAKTSVLLASTNNRLHSIFSLYCILLFLTVVEGAASNPLDPRPWMLLATATKKKPPVDFCDCWKKSKKNEWMKGTAWALQKREGCNHCKLEFIGPITNLGLESIIMSATKPRLYKIVWIPNILENRMDFDEVQIRPSGAAGPKNENVNKQEGSRAGQGTRLVIYNSAQDQTTAKSKILVKNEAVTKDIQILELINKFLKLLSDNTVLNQHQEVFLYKVQDFEVNGEHVGVLEIVKNSKNLAELLKIQETQTAATLPSSDGCGDKTFEYLTPEKIKRCNKFEDALVTSAAFSSIAGFLLGIGDRHWGNTLISLTPQPIYLHIDFGYVYGDTPHLELGFPLSLGFLKLLDDKAFKEFTLKMKEFYKALRDKIVIDELPEPARDIFRQRSTREENCKDGNEEDEVWKMVISNTMWRDFLNYLGTLSWTPYKIVAGINLWRKTPKPDIHKLLCVLQNNGETHLKLQEYIYEARTWDYNL